MACSTAGIRRILTADYSGLLDADGRPDPRWFRADRLHLDAAGYAHWTKVLRPVLERLAGR